MPGSIKGQSNGGPEVEPMFAPPTTTSQRRARLLRIGSVQGISESRSMVDEATSLQAGSTAGRSYGTLPVSGIRRMPLRGSASQSRTPTLSTLRVKLPPQHITHSQPTSPDSAGLSGSFRDSYFRPAAERPISAYDAVLAAPKAGVTPEDELDAKVNGIRVWYSSFTSIDWLHDAIKDSVRFSRLRKRKPSYRAHFRLLADKSMGWVVVSIVGFLTAVVAFLVIRSEQWLFDLKEGYCQESIWRAKEICCPPLIANTAVRVTKSAAVHLRAVGEETCSAWMTWEDALGPAAQRRGSWIGFERDVVEYVAYAAVALTLAVMSSTLTIYLTASNTFATRKDSGVLSDPTAPAKRKIMYYAAGSGIPEIKTILSGFVIHGYLGGRTLFTKSVGLALSVASGLSLGKEGPFVHIASCIGNIVSRFISKYENNEAKRREILSAACAAGVAVAFGAPIGGTLFSLEEVSYFFPPKVMWRSFFCAMIAAITLKFLDPFGTGKLVLFQVTYTGDWHAYELIFFIILGVFGGVYGAYFSKLNFRWSRDIRSATWLKSHPIAEVVLVTAVTTLFCFLNPYTRMGGTELVANLFAECRTGSGNDQGGLCVIDPSSMEHVWPVMRAILAAMLVKGALTVVTFGIKLPAGIFIPSLAVGACAGRVMGIFVQWLHWKYPESPIFEVCGGNMDCVVPGLYAMVGAAASLSGVTRTTVSLAVIMFELTDTLTYAVPVMLSVLVAKTVADAIEPKGIYELVINLSQLPYLDAKHEYMWQNLQINDVTDREVDVILSEKDNTVTTLRDQLQRLVDQGHDDSGFPVLRKDHAMDRDGTRLVGYIGASELEHALSIVADESQERVTFHTNFSHTNGDMSASSVSASSLMEDAHGKRDIFDFSVYMDQAPLTVQSNSPLELVHQFFVKLGARYVIVVDVDGCYEGIIDKKAWLAFLSELEERH